ncbi:MAG: exo-alpha-sialidase [Planctomycetaceae bacterium]
MPVNADDVRQLIAEVTPNGSRVDTILVCINAQTMYYPTQVGTMRGTLSTETERAAWPPSEKQRFANLNAFFESGVDPYALMLEEAKKRGLEALLTFRMNDDHGNDFLRTQFMLDHPDWSLGTEQYRGKGAMDFGHEEVRDYTFRLIEEAVRRYHCDGIELDFNRFPAFFKDGTAEERIAKMNSLLERIRRMVEEVGRERQRKLILAVRVPSNFGSSPPTPESARKLGCDVSHWVTSGWVDFVTVSEFLYEPDDLPLDLWKQAIPSVPVYGGIECVRSGADRNLSADEYLTAAKKRIDGGADGIYLFNFFTSRENGENSYEPPFEVLSSLGNLPADDRDRVRSMEAVADLALVPPTLNTTPLPRYGYDKLDYGMTIGIERTPGGRLWACWVAGGDSPDAFFVLASSDDHGDHWSDPRVVLDSHSPELPRPRSILVGNLWTDPKGRLWLIFDQSMDMFDGRAGVWASICDNPDAEIPQWSSPRRIWHGVTLNKPTVLSTGEWMLPISLDQRGGFGPFKGCFAELDSLRGANVFVSKDEGRTWSRRGKAVFPNPDWHEHMIVERRNGSLWMLARTSKGLMESTSTDHGQTWAEPVDSAIRHPNARFHVRRLQSGNLLLIKHGDRIDAHEGRVQLSAWLSSDDGHSWRGGLVLDERKGISYPDGFQAPDGRICISYDRNRATDGEILMARFTEADIEAGKLVSENSKLGMLICRPLAPKQ